MKIRQSMLAVLILMAQPALAQDISLTQVGTIADSVTPATQSPVFNALENQSLAALRNALKGSAPTLTRDAMEHAGQSGVQADTAWLEASGYDFQTDANEQAGIVLLETFSQLPESVLQANLTTVESINRDAPQASRYHALADAEGSSYLYFLSDAMGPQLGKAFLAAYDKGELNKAAALLKASEVGTWEAKKHFNNPRPFEVQGNSIQLVADDVVVKDGNPYIAGGGSFPSGHANTGYVDALLMAEMIPERFNALLERGARYGYSRIVLGVHYPLDVIGSRMLAQRNVATYLNDDKYRVLFNEARTQLRSALEKECGMPLAQCAKDGGKDDPYNAPEMSKFNHFTMTYGLPQQAGNEQPVQVPKGAEVLLGTALPQLSATQIHSLMVKTALPAGYPLSGRTPEQQFWQRLNLPDAYAMAKKLH